MKTRTETVITTHYVSDVTGIETPNESYRAVIEWADANPNAWWIVGNTKSMAWGKGSNVYLGECRDSSQPWAILMRLALYERYVREEVAGKSTLLGQNAVFALANCKAPGFTGGLFRQHDGKYDRDCITLDYTPGTREYWTDQFVQWAENGPCKHPTDHVLLNGIVVREECRHGTKTASSGKVTCNECGKVVQTLW